MASHSLPVPLQRQNERSKGAAPTRTLSLVVAALVALLILLSWLHLIQALEIADTGRKIQAAEEELEQIERINNELRIKIAEGQTPAKVVAGAERLGFRRSQPVYVVFPDSLAEADTNAGGAGAPAPTSRDSWTEDERALFDFAAGLEALLEVEVAP